MRAINTLLKCVIKALKNRGNRCQIARGYTDAKKEMKGCLYGLVAKICM